MNGKKQITQIFILIVIFSQLFLFNSNSSVNSELDKLPTREGSSSTTGFEITDSISIDSIFDEGLLSKNSENNNWTYMLYLDADNDIEGDAIRDFEWLEQAGGSNENFSYVVLLDRIPGFDNTHGNWDGSRIYNVTADVSITTIDSQLMVDLGEVDMADQTTLTNFITYCFDNFPADNYILDLWNHGHAAYGVIDDVTSGSHFIINDIQQAITNALASSSEEIDIISMDACNMITIEVAWEMRNLCKYFISSEDGTNGYPYNVIAERLKLNPGINVSSFCELMVDAYAYYYQNFYKACLSVINQTRLLDFPVIFNAFLSDLVTTLDNGNYKDVFAFAREISYDFYDENWVDFITLIENILTFLDNQALNLAAEDFLNILDQIVVYNWQHHSYFGQARGVTIYMPFGLASLDVIYTYINGLSFCSDMDWHDDTQWDEFLAYYMQNYLYYTLHEPQMLNLDEELEGCSIQQNSIKLYQINLWQNTIYEFTCAISSGDVDIKIFEFDFSGIYELIGGSYLINPNDATTEFCRFRLNTGFYLITVHSKNTTSSFDLEVRKSEMVELVCNSPQTAIGGSLLGDGQGHYKQDLNHYYQIALPYGNNTITLTNSETANYQLTIFDEFWHTLFFLPALGLGETLTLLYNHTGETSITLILEICGFSGSGEFTIEIKNPLEPTPKMGFSYWQFMLFMSLILVVYKKRKIKNNS